jgi:FAD/FMN-containing dehydrogenase
MPRDLAELKTVLEDASKNRVTVRVSGQRHSQPPLVADDNRNGSPATAKSWLVDLSCYADLGLGRNTRIVPGPGPKQVTVNTGVREDELDAYLTGHNLMLKTVTAGGFFSLGGMTAVNVHGGTIDAPTFAETVSASTIVRADGSELTIDAQSPRVGTWSPLQFARVSLGGLGIVTSITIDVMDRPWATTLKGGTERIGLADKPAFVEKCKTLSGVIEDGFDNPAVIAAITFDVIEPEVATANSSHSEMWLTGAVRVIFMSYYIPLPALDDDGLGKVWDGLDVVSQIVTKRTMGRGQP